MSDVDRLIFEDEQGNDYTMFIEAAEGLDLPETTDSDDEFERMGPSDVKVKLSEVHDKLQSYARYAIGAFQNVPFVDVEEITLKFGIKISGSTGIPVLTRGSVEGDFHIEIKCKPEKRSDV